MGILVFLSSGLFLGWSLGANDAANVWGTAVGTRMVSFKKAALVCSVFVIIGAVSSGSGAAHTLGKLAQTGTMAGAFTIALSAAVTVLWMTRMALPVSTSQAVVGSLLGWTVFAGNRINWLVLGKIAGTWIFSPLLTAAFSIILFLAVRRRMKHVRLHLFRQDWLIRWLLIIVGAFGSFSLGANNIANVMGVFTAVSPFRDLVIWDLFYITATQQLFFLGGVAIAVGVYTFSRQVMMTVGNSIYTLSPLTALIVVASSSLVLFLFASQGLKDLLVSSGLPSFPLVPVSSSQSIVGGVMGIGLVKGGKNLNYNMIGHISLGWLATPLIAAVISYVLLFIMQNVFTQIVV